MMRDYAEGQSFLAGRSPFFAGFRAALPLWLGITPFGLVVGLLGPAVGLSAPATAALSAFVFAGSAQFIALGLIGARASYALIVLTTLVVNLRHLLYGASLAPYLRSQPAGRKAVLSFFLTDEAYAVVIDHFRRPGVAPTVQYYLGVGLSLYLDWVASTVAGLAVGGLVPDPAALGLDFALPATFIALLAPQLKGWAAWVTFAVAGVTVLLAGGLPGRLGILLAIVVATTAGWGMEEWLSRS